MAASGCYELEQSNVGWYGLLGRLFIPDKVYSERHVWYTKEA